MHVYNMLIYANVFNKKKIHFFSWAQGIFPAFYEINLTTDQLTDIRVHEGSYTSTKGRPECKKIIRLNSAILHLLIDWLL